MNRTHLLAVLVGLTSLTATAANFPDAGGWLPVSINPSDGGTTAYLGDPLGDGSGNGKDLVGDNLRPAFYIASNATDFFFRMRLDTSPAGPGGLGSFGWGILIDADGILTDYDYSLMVNGTAERIEYARNDPGSGDGDPSDNAEIPIVSPYPSTSYTAPTTNIVITPVGAGAAGFGGTEDYFLDIAVPLRMLYGMNPDGGATYPDGGTYSTFGPTTPVRFWVGSSPSAQNVSLDIGGTGGNPGPGTLPGTASNPTFLCTADSQCGGPTSGLVCNSGACAPGCRGTDGNSCPSGQSCTSTTSVIGTCVAAGVPGIVTPANLSFTANPRPPITGTGPANALITVYIDSASVGTTTSDASGNWTFTPPSDLANGPHTVGATATVSTIVSALSPIITFTVDTLPPAIPTIAAPADGSRINTASPTITGTADPGTTVTIYIDDVAVGTTVATIEGTYSFQVPTSLSAASHTVRVTSADRVNNLSTSTTNTFTIDLTAPTAPVIATPASGSSTNDTTPDFSGTAEANSTVELFVDGVSIGTTTANGSGAWSFTPSTPLTEGAHAVYATARDAAGNTSLASTTNNFRVDLTAPSAPVVTTPANASRVGTGTPTYSGTAEANATVEVFVDGVSIGTTTANASGAWSKAQIIALSDGSHTVKATARDAAGNTSVDSNTNTFTIDTTPPAAPVVIAPANGSITNDSTPNVSGTAEANSTVTIIIDGLTLGTATADASGNWTFTSTVLVNGPHSVVARATDAVGNPSVNSAANAFTVDTVAPAAPVVLAPADGSRTANTTPAISGTAEANSTVRVFIDGTLRGTVSANASGAWTFTSPALADGPHTVKATATDAANNTSADSNTNTFTVDTTSPSAPVVVGPANGAITGDSTPDVSGTAEANSTVTVIIDGTPRGTATANASGQWTFTSPTLLDGSHTVRVTATDAVGNVSPTSNTNTFTVDTAAPAAPVVLAPANGAFINDNTPDVTGTAEANSTVTVFIDGTSQGTTQANAAGAWTFTSATLSNGPHAVKVTARDVAGNTSADSNTNTFTVDTIAPAAPVVTGPANGTITANPRPAITGTAEANSTVTVFIDGVAAGTTTASASGAWTFTPSTTLSEGTHAVKATARDAAGNVSADSNTSSFTVDSQASGAPAISTPADGSSTMDTTPSISGTSDAAGLTITVRIDGQVSGVTVSTTGGAWSYVAPELALGVHSVSATATDTAGNVSPTSATNSFTVLPQPPPAPTLTGPVDGDVSSDTTPTFSGLAEPNSTVTVRVDGEIVCTTTATAQGVFSCTPAQSLAPGAHVVTASAANAGGTSPQSQPSRFIIDTTPPLTPFVAGPAPGSSTTDTTPAISGTGEPGSLVAIFVDGQRLGAVTVAADGTWRFEPGTPLSVGDHQVSARATDAAGNESLPSNTNPFSVVTPNASRPTLTAPADNAALNTGTPTFSGTAAPGAMVTVVVDGQPVCSATAAADGSWSCAPSQPLGPGLHRAVAEVGDGMGGTLSSDTRTFTVDTTAPGAPVVTGPVEGSSTTDPTPALEGTAEALSTVKVYVDGVLVGTVTADVDGRWSLTSAPLPLGPHTVSATATDRAGNTSPASALNHFTVVSPNGAPVVLGPAAGTATNDSTPTYTGTSAPNADVEVLVDGVVVCTARASASGAWSCTGTTPLLDGPHQVAAREQGSPTTSPQVPFSVDTVAPAAPVITAPTPNAYTSATPTIAGTAEAGARVEVKIDGVAVCVTLADGQGRWSCVPPAPLAEGAHSVTATATDVAGNVSPPATPVPFNVDLTPPSKPNLSAPTSGSSTTDTTPRFAGSAEPLSTVTVRVDGVVVCTATADAQGAFACEASAALPRGAHVATATATDAAGNSSVPSDPVSFSIVPVTPPTPVITGPIGGVLLADATPRITGTAEAGSTVTVRDAATQEVLCTATADAQGNWSCESKPIADGPHAITATAEKDGGASQPSDQATFRVDTTPPAVNVEGTPPKPITSTTGTNFSWTAEPETTYQCSVDGGPFQDCTSPLSLPGLTPGTHTITVRATDAAGNTTETDTTWLVEDPVVIDWSVVGGGLSCAALPADALAPLALVLLALRRRRR